MKTLDPQEAAWEEWKLGEEEKEQRPPTPLPPGEPVNPKTVGVMSREAALALKESVIAFGHYVKDGQWPDRSPAQYIAQVS